MGFGFGKKMSYEEYDRLEEKHVRCGGSGASLR